MKFANQKPTVISLRSSRAPVPIAAPDVAVAFHDADDLGLIPVSALGAPITVDLTVWEGAEERYVYQLLWDGEPHGPEKEITSSEQPGDPLTLEIPVALQTNGRHSLAFRTYSPNTTVEDESAVFPVVIDRSAPGKPLLAAIQFPVEVQNGLTAAELEQLGDKLDVEIAGYTGMAKHDVIKTYWGDVLGPTATVTENDMGLNKVSFDFPKDFLDSIEPGPHAVKYNVTDRAGNVSEYSVEVTILLLLTQIPTDYPAPLVDPSIGDLIDHAEARPGVKVDVPHYPGATEFDLITLFWGADKPMLPVQIAPGDENEQIVLSVRVPYETIAATPIGQVEITYSVSRQNQLNGSSLPAQVGVFITLPIAEPMTAPVIQGTSVQNPDKTDNFIDEDDYELNGRAIVEWTDEFEVNDDLNLFWGDQQRLQWHQINEEDVAQKRDLIIPIANSIMKAQGTGSEIPVRYTVTRAGNPNSAASPAQKVTVRSKEELPGGPDGIDGPTFVVTPAGYISLIVAPDGTEGSVAPYLNIAENQKLFFTFKGFDLNNNPIEAATYTASRELDDRDVVEGYKFKVPFNTLRTICRGYCEAYIRVEPAPGSNQSAVTSRITRVPVDMRRTNESVCSISA